MIKGPSACLCFIRFRFFKLDGISKSLCNDTIPYRKILQAEKLNVITLV